MTEAATTTTADTDAAKERDKKVRAAYQTATTLLRENHREEFIDLQKAECAKVGVDWSPRPSKAEKAEAELQALLKANPDLAQRLADEVRKKVETESGAASPGYATAPAEGSAV